MLVANRVGGDTGTFGGHDNTVHLITRDGVEDWPRLSKIELGTKLAERIARALAPLAWREGGVMVAGLVFRAGVADG